MKSNIWSFMKSHKKITILLIIFLLLLILLPVALKYAAIDWLEDNGAKNVTLKDVDLNLFTGTLGIEEFSIHENDQRRLSISGLKLNLSVLSLFRKRILVESFVIDGLDMAVEQTKEQLLLGMPIPLDQKTGNEPEPTEKTQEKALPAFGVKALKILNSKLSYNRVDLSGKAAINAFELKNLISWKPATTARLLADLSINDSPFQADVQMNVFSPEKRVNAQIRLKKLSFEPFGNLAAFLMEDLHGYLDIDNQLLLSVYEDGNIRIEQSGNLAVMNFGGMLKTAEGRQMLLQDMDMGWKGSSIINLSSDLHPAGINLSGEFLNGHLMAKLTEPEATVQHEGIHIPLSVSSDNLDDLNTLKATANITLNKLLLKSDALGIDIFSLEGLDVQSIDMKGLNKIGVSAIIAEYLAIAAPHKSNHPSIPASLISNQKIEIAGIQMNEQSHIMLDTVEIHEFAASIYRNQKEEFPLVKLLTRFATPQADTSDDESKQVDQTNDDTQAKDNKTAATESDPVEPEKSEKSQPIGIKIGTVYFSGNNSIHFIDESLDPKLERLVNIDEISVKNIDNSDINNSADLILSMHVDKHGSIETKGKIRPFLPKVDLDLEGRIKNVNLPPISPYLSKYLGYNIKTGVLSLDYVFKVDAGIIDAGNEVVLKNIKLVPDDQNKIDQLSKQLTMPLDKALSILRDKNDDVNLSIPIKGDIENPDFNLNDIIGKALGKALKMASVSVIKYLLQPYGALITIASLAKKGGEYLAEIKIDPINFDLGSAELTVEATDYLKTVKKLMSEKKEMRLTICGVAVPGDLPNLTVEGNEENFLSLANQRAQVIQDYFVSQGISVERLFVCNPEVDIEKEAQPRATMSL